MHINNLQILKEAHHQHIKPHESQIVLQNPGLSFAKNADKICTIESQAIPKSPTLKMTKKLHNIGKPTHSLASRGQAHHPRSCFNQF